MTATRTPAITPEALADRLARAEAVTILDVRDDASWTVAAPTAAVRHVPAARVLEEPDRVARQVSGPVVTVCGRGISARPVADALRVRGVDAKVLEGGMRGWLGVLREHRWTSGP